MSNNKVKVIEDENDLSLSYKWFNPSAIFLLVFSTIWLGITSTMFASIGLGLELLLALPFVGVGLGLGYQSIGLMVNKTQLLLSEGNLKIKHGPLPFWKPGLELEAADLEQLYVRELKSYNREQGHTSISYELRAKTIKGSDITLMKMGHLTSKEAKQIEEKIEASLGLPDYRVPGELLGSGKPEPKELPRKETTPALESANAKIRDLRVGSIIDYEEVSYEVKHTTQYDWLNGDSDRLFQLVDAKNIEVLLYLQRIKGMYKPLIEVQLDFTESKGIQFDTENPPATVNFKGLDFKSGTYLKGKMFTNKSRHHISAEQWIYEGKEGHLRIVNNDGLLTYYLGKKESDVAFENLYVKGS